MDDIERLEQLLASYEQQIKDDHALIEELTETIELLKKEIKTSLVRTGSSCNVAVKNIETVAQAYKTGKPEGYDALVDTVNGLKNVQDKTLVPFISDLAVTGFNRTAWDAWSAKLEEVRELLNTKTVARYDFSVVDLGLISTSSLISQKVRQGISFVTLIFDDGEQRRSLQGFWCQRDATGSGIVLDNEGNAFLLTEEGDSVKIKLLEESKEQETVLVTADELAFVKQLAGAGLSVDQLVTALSNLLKEESNIKAVDMVSAGVVTADNGAAKILEHTYNGLQFLKMTLGGITLSGFWIRENTYGYGLMFDPEKNLWRVYLDGLDIKAKKIESNSDLISNNIVSADVEALLKLIEKAETAANDLTSPNGRIAQIDNRMELLEGRTEGFMAAAEENFAAQTELEALISAVGTVDKIDDKNLVQLLLEMKHDIMLLKESSSSTNDTVDTSTPVLLSVSPQHELFLKIINNMISLGNSAVTGDTLISQGLLAVTNQSLSVWKADFINEALWTDNTADFLESFNIVLTDEDTGSILGRNCGSGITYKTEDVVLADYERQLVYPAADITLAKDDFKITMRAKITEGLEVLVLQPELLSESQRDTVKKMIAWYLPASMALIEKATGLSFNSPTSKLSKVRFSYDEGFVTFGIKAITVVFDEWAQGYNVKTPDKDNFITVNISAVDSDTKKASAVVFDINSNYYGVISGNNGIGINSAPMAFDRAVCHSLTKAVLAANISNFDTLPLWFKEGMAAVVHGFDDIAIDVTGLLNSRERLEKALSQSPVYESFEQAQDPVVAGYLFIRYLLFTIATENKAVTTAEENLSQSAMFAKRIITSMKNSAFLNPTLILDEGIASLGSKYKTAADIKGEFLDELSKAKRQGDTAQIFLNNKCGIILTDQDNGSLSGISAGNKLPAISAESAVQNNSWNDIIYPVNKVHFGQQPFYFKYVEGVLFMFPDKAALSEEQQYTMALISSRLLEGILQQIEELTGLSLRKQIQRGALKLNDTVTTYDTPFILISFDTDDITPYQMTENEPVTTVVGYNTETLQHDIVNIIINSEIYGMISHDNNNGQSVNFFNKPNLDIMLLQALARAALQTNLKGERYPLWFLEGFSRLLGGADSELSDNLLNMLNDFSRTEAAFDPDITELDKFADIKDPGTAGYAMLRYMFNQFL